MQLFRIAVQMKETDKRKNAVVFRYVVMADTLDEAKVLAVAAKVSPEGIDYPATTLAQIAAVWGHSMSTLAYNADIYVEKDKTEHPETVPPLDAVRAAQRRMDEYETAHEEPDEGT